MKTAVVVGAGGFIGGYLVGRLLAENYSVRAADIKPFSEWWQVHNAASNLPGFDCSDPGTCRAVMHNGADEVYQLAADMGGMGFIEANKARCMLSVLTNTNMLVAARDVGVGRFFYSSSACVYAAGKQDRADLVALKETDAYPAMPEDGYGWEKLFSERMCRHFTEDFGLETRVARFHNVYGPLGSWTGGREKAPAAICRKVAEAIRDRTGEIEIWGDGTQTRSFMFIDDCVEGIRRIMKSDIRDPVNLGSSELVSVNELVDIVESIAGVTLARRYKLDAPRGVMGRCSDNSMILDRLGWQPRTLLRDGLTPTYRWVASQVDSRASDKPTVA